MMNFTQVRQTITNLPTKIKITAIIIVSLVLVAVLALLILHARRYVTTDNAYVNADMIKVATQIDGRVVRVHVTNNQMVKAGALLFELDPLPFTTALTKEKAQLAMAEANLSHAQINTQRVLALAKKQVLSTKDRDEAIKNLQVALAAVQLSKAAVAQATLDLTNSRIFAATDGYITNLSLGVGSTVSAFEPLFVLISKQKYWVDANFKETELKNIKVNQRVKVAVDMYPAHQFVGKVESISGGSGSAFALLPAQNATGNWIKITQRVPIKVQIINPDPRYPLRVGTTATVVVDTHSK